MPPFLVHVGLMVGGFILLVSGVYIVMRLRKQRWWFKTHRWLGLLGAGALLLGLVAAAVMVSLSSGRHVQGLHAYLGVATILLALITVSLGLLQFRLKKKSIRIIHHWTGRATVIMQALTILVGLRLIGIL